jgi:hypothetical protein
MTPRFVLKRSASIDIADATAWYALRSTSLAAEFVRALTSHSPKYGAQRNDSPWCRPGYVAPWSVASRTLCSSRFATTRQPLSRASIIAATRDFGAGGGDG